jgi:hypothetical protein
MNKFAGLGLATDVASRMPIMHPITGQPLRHADTGAEAFIELLSSDSAVARRVDRATSDKRLRSRARRLTAEELEGDRMEKLAKLTRGWSLVRLDGGALDVPFSEGTARELYAEPSMAWLRDQAQAWVDDLGNYAGSQSSNSSTSPATSAGSEEKTTAAPVEAAAST